MIANWRIFSGMILTVALVLTGGTASIAQAPGQYPAPAQQGKDKKPTT